MMKFVFAGDPMCSWCYGFSKELGEALEFFPELPFEIKVAGLWAGGRDVLDSAAKQFRLTNWARVESLTGVPFNRQALMDRVGFVYDTEPISRAFVAAKTLAPDADQLAIFHALQRAFYVDGLDTTADAVLSIVVQKALADQSVDRSVVDVVNAMSDQDVRSKTQSDFAQVRGWGLRSFPKLLAVDGEKATILCDGFAKASAIKVLVEAAVQSA